MRDANQFVADKHRNHAMGYERIKTAILATESGHSLEASGWTYSHTTKAQEWDRPSRRRKPTPHASAPKKIYYKELI